MSVAYDREIIILLITFAAIAVGVIIAFGRKFKKDKSTKVSKHE